MLTVIEAETRILARASLRPAACIPFANAAGHVQREAFVADRDVPPYDRATMDGTAIAFSPRRLEFRNEGLQAAGEPAKRLVNSADGCHEIMTGAMRPEGAGTIVPYEDTEIRKGGRAPPTGSVRFTRTTFPSARRRSKSARGAAAGRHAPALPAHCDCGVRRMRYGQSNWINTP